MKKSISQSWLRTAIVVILGLLILNSKRSVFAQVISPQRPPIKVLGKQGFQDPIRLFIIATGLPQKVQKCWRVMSSGI